MREHLRSEVKHNMMEPQFSDIEEWVTKGLPTAFTSNVFQRIIMHFQADQIYVHGVGWKDAGLHFKEAQKDDSAVQATKAGWLNGLVEKVSHILRVVLD